MTRARNSANLASHGNLFVDIANDRTGIGSVVPAQNLHVAGTTGFHSDVTFTGDLYNATWDRSDNSLKFADNAKIKLGADGDLEIVHDPSNGIIRSINSGGNMHVESKNHIELNVAYNPSSGYKENALKAIANQGVSLFFNGLQKFQTTDYGTNTTGTAVNDGLVVAGVATVTTMNVTGVLTYDDVTSVDSIGIVTARQGIHVTGGSVLIGSTTNTGHTGADDLLVANDSGHAGLTVRSSSSHHAQVSFADGTSGNDQYMGQIIYDHPNNVMLFRANGPVERFRVTSDGAQVTGALNVTDNILLADALRHRGDMNTQIRFPSNETITMEIDGTESLRIDSNGRLLHGTTSSLIQDYRYRLQIQRVGSNAYDSGMLGLYFTGSSNANAQNTPTAIGFHKKESDGSALSGGIGILRFNGHDGSNYVEAATIEARVDGNAGTNDMPGRITFSTTADGASSPTERLRITSDGQLKQTAASGDTIFTFKRSDTNTTGAVGVLNFAASDDHSVANIQVLGDGDNEGAHIVFKTTSAAASADPYNAATAERLRIKSDGHIEQTITGNNVGFDQVAAGNNYISNVINANRSSANDHIFIQRGLWNGTEVATMKFRAGSDTSNKDDGYITFETSSANNVTERLRITSTGIHKITTPGDTADGTYYSTLTINNTGSSTWSRLRFDRSDVAKWGLSLGTDDKFRISNLYTDGSSGSPNDNCFVIQNNNDIGINVSSPNFRLHVNGTGRFESDLSINSGQKIYTNNSQGQLTIMGGATYPGGAIKFAGGQSGATDRGTAIFYAGTATSLEERLRLNKDGHMMLRSSSVNYLVLGSSGDSGFGATISNNMNWIRGNANHLQMNTCTGGFMGFEIGGTERLRIHTDGEVECKGGGAGQNALLVSGNYASNSSVDIQTWQRIGGAVQAKMIYRDANTDMIFGTDTAHKLNLMTGGTARFEIGSGGTMQVLGGNELRFCTSTNNNVRGHIISTETNDEHLIIATSGGEDIAFKDGGVSGHRNMIIRGDGNVIIDGGQLRTDAITPKDGLPTNAFGGIIQVKWSANVDNANYSSTSDVTMQTVEITPQRSDCRMLIHVVYPSIRSYTTGNTRNRLNHHIKRDGSEIYSLPEMPQWRGANFDSSGVEINKNVVFTHIDAPSTTNTVTYTATWQSADGHVWNTASAQMTMIVAELTGY